MSLRYKYSILFQWLLILSVGIFTLSQFSPPASIKATSPIRDFSADRAIAHLIEMTRYPHPVGSKAHGQVQDYLSCANSKFQAARGN